MVGEENGEKLTVVPRASMLEPTWRSLPVCCTVVSYSCRAATSFSNQLLGLRNYGVKGFCIQGFKLSNTKDLRAHGFIGFCIQD